MGKKNETEIRVFSLKRMIEVEVDAKPFPPVYKDAEDCNLLWYMHDGHECYKDAYGRWRVDGWPVWEEWTLSLEDWQKGVR